MAPRTARTLPPSKPVEAYDPEVLRIGRALKWPPEQWKGQCYGVAKKMVDAGLAPGGTAVYGHYTGPIAPTSLFADRRALGFCQHGWILMVADGSVVDPTRWVFEDVEPYIYRGKADYYDEGGNGIRASFAGPPPSFDDRDVSRATYRVTGKMLSGPAWSLMEDLLRLLDDVDREREIDEVSQEQLFWLANVAYDTLQPHTAEIYKMLEKLRLGPFIPVDNRDRAEREAKRKG